MSEHKTLVEVQHLQQYFPAGGVGKNRKYVQAVDDVSFAIRKGDDKLRARLDKALDEIRADGTYDKIYAKWFGGNK